MPASCIVFTLVPNTQQNILRAGFCQHACPVMSPCRNTYVSTALTTCDLGRSVEGCKGIFLALYQHHHPFLLTTMHCLEELFGLEKHTGLQQPSTGLAAVLLVQPSKQFAFFTMRITFWPCSSLCSQLPLSPIQQLHQSLPSLDQHSGLFFPHPCAPGTTGISTCWAL